MVPAEERCTRVWCLQGCTRVWCLQRASDPLELESQVTVTGPLCDFKVTLTRGEQVHGLPLVLTAVSMFRASLSASKLV